MESDAENQECCEGPGSLSATADPELVADGWERRFVADELRAAEAVGLYRQLGFEARADPVNPATEISPDCKDCAIVLQLKYKTIYTRRSRP